MPQRAHISDHMALLYLLCTLSLSARQEVLPSNRRAMSNSSHLIALIQQRCSVVADAILRKSRSMSVLLFVRRKHAVALLFIHTPIFVRVHYDLSAGSRYASARARSTADLLPFTHPDLPPPCTRTLCRISRGNCWRRTSTFTSLSYWG